MIFALVVFSLVLENSQSFAPKNQFANSLLLHRASTSDTATTQSTPTWQEDVDTILNIDTECNSRRDVAFGLVNKVNDIRNDVMDAIQDKDIKKVAPSNLKYGKAVAGIQTFQRQLVNDIFPDLVTKTIPKVIELGPKFLNDLVKSLPETSKDIVSTAREISQDPSALQSTLDDLRKEVRNVFLSTPEGLDTPLYTLLKQTEAYEIRKYDAYSVCSTPLTGTEGSADQEIVDPISSGNSFNVLASYIFGKNSRKEKMSMTTPVIMEKNIMEFVLSKGMSSETAPFPDADNIKIKDVPSEIVAAREFTGIATEGEVSRQRAFLEDSLLSDGIMYDNLSFKVLQYNPPYTLPWVRRNEVTVRVFYKDTPSDNDVESSNKTNEGDASTFFTSPEAGD